MDIEREQAYIRFLERQNTGKILREELSGTAFLQDFGRRDLVEGMLMPLYGANMIIARVDQNIVKPIVEDLLESGANRVDALLTAIQTCIHPVSSSILAEKEDIDKLSLMIAATHAGTVRMAELYQMANEEEKIPIHVDALLFAAAQARLLNFRTSTTLLAIDIKDEAYLRLENILVEAPTEGEEQLLKNRTKILFRGYGASDIRQLGDRKFFTAGGALFRT